MSKRKEERITTIKELEKRIVAMNGTLETMALEGGSPPPDIKDVDKPTAFKVGYRTGVKASQRALWSYFADVLKAVHGEDYGVYIRW